jgi:hypothetical protein
MQQSECVTSQNTFFSRTLSFLDYRALDVTQVDSNVVDEVLLLGVVHHLLPECTGLFEIDY